MSRSCYSDDCEHLDLFRANVERSIHGRRGQAFLHEMAAALDAMPVKRLASGVLVEDGECCAIGSVAIARGMDVEYVDEFNPEEVAEAFRIPEILAQEIAFQNDEATEFHRVPETDEERWTRMRKWVDEQIADAT